MLLPLLLTLACQEDDESEPDLQDRLNTQLTQIETYLSDNNISVTKENGYFIETITENPSGNVASQGDIVLAYYELQTLDGDLVDEVSQANGDDPETIPFIQDRIFLPIGLYDVISSMRAGEEVRVFLPFNRAYFDYERPNLIPAYSPIVLQLQIPDIISPAELKVRQNEQIKAYLADNDLLPADSLRGGVYYHQEQAGGTPEVENQSIVSVRYSGTLLDGTQFDSNADAANPFVVNMSENGVIDGFKTALLEMSQREEAVALLPADQAYGEGVYVMPFTITSDLIAGRLLPGTAALGTYSILRFDLEVEAVN